MADTQLTAIACLLIFSWTARFAKLQLHDYD